MVFVWMRRSSNSHGDFPLPFFLERHRGDLMHISALLQGLEIAWTRKCGQPGWRIWRPALRESNHWDTIETPLRISVEPLLQLTEYLCFKYSITVFDRAYFLWPYSQAFRSISTDGQHPNLEQRNALLGSWCDLADHQPFIPTRNLVVWLGWALRGSGPWGQTAKRGRKTNWLVHCLPVFLDETVAGYRWVSCFTYEWVAWCNLWRSDKRAFVQRGLFSGIISLSVCDIS